MENQSIKIIECGEKKKKKICQIHWERTIENGNANTIKHFYLLSFKTAHKMASNENEL